MAKLGELLILLKAKNEAVAELTKTNTQLDINKAKWNESTKGVEKTQAKIAKTTRTSNFQLTQMRMGVMAMGTALTATGSLLNRLDNQFAKTTGNALMFAGATITTISGVMQMIAYLPKLTGELKKLAIMQGVVSALSGPAGWGKLAIGGLIGAGTVGAIMGVSKLSSSSNSSVASASKSNQPVNIVISGDARKMGISARQETYKYQDRNSSSGIR
jgi:hypothetical protein